MKKLAVFVCALFSAISAFAYHNYDYYDSYNHYGYSRHHDDGMSVLAIFTLIVMISSIVLSIIVLIKFWKMANDVKNIRQHVTNANPKLTYLVAVGEKEQAEKAALKMVVDILYPIYFDSQGFGKAQRMNEHLATLLPKIQRLDISIPDYATSGEKFIDYMNNLTGRQVHP